MEAYKKGYSLQTLNLELNLAQDDPEAITYSLAQEEQDMRTVWLSLVFLTCAKAGVSRPSYAVEPKDDHGLSRFVTMVVEAFRKGYDLERLKLEQRLAASSADKDISSPEQQAKQNLESAVLSQSMRIVMLTCEEISGGKRPPGGVPPDT
eukprot:CAMPEP_0184657770 /NCGR_PEP_ID=MMETSP0308-20130426/21756_1 /TAXON_ID=38269 /ORGANISM="Gloeochaete witrockiana, Strain SAG 46.84" /LENGTH=149 /DNA_ID=CAMNT_0027096025 /DNA_START=295 /DNA_END=744 /DNA_ORIENTATION=-